jgi:hypothetical protein
VFLLRKFIKIISFSSFLFLFSFTLSSLSLDNKVEALPFSNVCTAVSSTINPGTIYSVSCGAGNTVTYTFNYDFNVTGFSSGSDGY